MFNRIRSPRIIIEQGYLVVFGYLLWGIKVFLHAGCSTIVVHGVAFIVAEGTGGGELGNAGSYGAGVRR